jgi:hypothetical protein
VVKDITSFSNPLVKHARGLREKKQRRAEGLFLAEGLRILTEAREAGVLPERIFFSDGSHRLVQALVEAVEATGGEAIETTEDILHKISGKENPQAVIGIFRQFDTSLASIDRTAAPLWIAAQALRDPQDRRRGRRWRADPHRRYGRSLFGGGGAGVDGGDVHPADRDRAVGRVRELAAERARAAGRDEPEHRSRLSGAALRSADLPAGRQ